MGSSSVNSSGRLVAALKHEFAHLAPGERVPGVRELMERHAVSPVTVSRALSQLVREGLIVTRPGSGTFMAAPPAPVTALDLGWQSVALGARSRISDPVQRLLVPPRDDAIPLGSGYPDESLQPLVALDRAAARAAKRPGVWHRASREGLEALRAWFAAQLGGDTRAADVLIAPGGQAAVSSVLRALVPPGGTICVESPTYFGALAVCQGADISTSPVPVDAEGVRPDLLEASLRATNARVVYLQPLYQNPTGAVLSPERRRAVLEIAARHSAFIVEDDYAREFCLHGAPPPPLHRLEPGRVVYLRSLSKSAAPSLRVAAIVARGPVMERLRVMRSVDDLFVSQFLQEIALELVTGSGWERHLAQLRTRLRARQAVAIAALARHFPEATLTGVPSGGFTLWLHLPPTDPEFSRAAELAHLQIHEGRAWFPAEPSGHHLRLSIAGANEAQLETGIAQLGALWRGARE